MDGGVALETPEPLASVAAGSSAGSAGAEHAAEERLLIEQRQPPLQQAEQPMLATLDVQQVLAATQYAQRERDMLTAAATQQQAEAQAQLPAAGQQGHSDGRQQQQDLLGLAQSTDQQQQPPTAAVVAAELQQGTSAQQQHAMLDQQQLAALAEQQQQQQASLDLQQLAGLQELQEQQVQAALEEQQQQQGVQEGLPEGDPAAAVLEPIDPNSYYKCGRCQVDRPVAEFLVGDDPNQPLYSEHCHACLHEQYQEQQAALQALGGMVELPDLQQLLAAQVVGLPDGTIADPALLQQVAEGAGSSATLLPTSAEQQGQHHQHLQMAPEDAAAYAASLAAASEQYQQQLLLQQQQQQQQQPGQGKATASAAAAEPGHAAPKGPTKVCTKCKQTRPLRQFALLKGKKKGRAAHCNQCKKKKVATPVPAAAAAAAAVMQAPTRVSTRKRKAPEPRSDFTEEEVDEEEALAPASATVAPTASAVQATQAVQPAVRDESEAAAAAAAGELPAGQLMAQVAGAVAFGDLELAAAAAAGMPAPEDAGQQTAVAPDGSTYILVTEKACMHCNQIKPAAAFRRSKNKTDRLQNRCKDCEVALGRGTKRDKSGPPVIRVAHKLCRRCNTDKPAELFFVSKLSLDGLCTYCKACQKDLNRAARAKREARPDMERQEVAEKECRHCKEVKPASQFFKSKMNLDGLYSYCKSCATVLNSASKKRRRAQIREERGTKKGGAGEAAAARSSKRSGRAAGGSSHGGSTAATPEVSESLGAAGSAGEGAEQMQLGDDVAVQEGAPLVLPQLPIVFTEEDVAAVTAAAAAAAAVVGGAAPGADPHTGLPAGMASVGLDSSAAAAATGGIEGGEADPSAINYSIQMMMANGMELGQQYDAAALQQYAEAAGGTYDPETGKYTFPAEFIQQLLQGQPEAVAAALAGEGGDATAVSAYMAYADPAAAAAATVAAAAAGLVEGAEQQDGSGYALLPNMLPGSEHFPYTMVPTMPAGNPQQQGQEEEQQQPVEAGSIERGS